MKTVQIAFRYFWRGFQPEHFLRMHPYLEREFELVPSRDPDVLFYSCFGPAVLRGKFVQPAVMSRAVKVFYSGEWVRPDMHRCAYAFTFCRDVDGERHFRLPHYVPALDHRGLGLRALVRRPGEGAAAMARKQRFCTFAATNSVARREDFVRRLAQYKPVDCIGPRLNTGAIVPRAQKTEYCAGSKFVIAFENQAEPGYVTEKITDAFQARSVPLYWGAPDVALDFRPASFLDRGACAGDEDFIERIVALDQDDALYEAMLEEPCLPGNQVPPELAPETILDRFREIFDFALSRSRKTWFVFAFGH